MKKITPRLQEIDEITEYNQQKMMAAFHEAESVKVILYLLQATATVTGEETLGHGICKGVGSRRCSGTP